MRRREVVLGLAGALATAPSVGRAHQQARAMPLIAVMMPLAEDDPEQKPWNEALLQALRALGWRSGHNIQIEYRWASGAASPAQRHAAEFIALAPDVIIAFASVTLAPLLQGTREIPIVFLNVADPVGAGFVESLARPGGNATGFSWSEDEISVKWVELLKEVAPNVTRAAVVRDPAITAGVRQWGAIEAVAPSLGIKPIPINVRDPTEIEASLADFARTSDGGVVVTTSPLAATHRRLMFDLTARYKLPAVYFARLFTKEGGLVSYGPDLIDPYSRAAGYVDRILKGEKPASMPVQAPTRYELLVNLKTARDIGLTIPPHASRPCG